MGATSPELLSVETLANPIDGSEDFSKPGVSAICQPGREPETKEWENIIVQIPKGISGRKGSQVLIHSLVHLSIINSIHLCIHLYITPIYPSTYPLIHPSVSPICSAIHLPIGLSIHHSHTHPRVYSSTDPFNHQPVRHLPNHQIHVAAHSFILCPSSHSSVQPSASCQLLSPLLLYTPFNRHSWASPTMAGRKWACWPLIWLIQSEKYNRVTCKVPRWTQRLLPQAEGNPLQTEGDTQA